MASNKNFKLTQQMFLRELALGSKSARQIFREFGYKGTGTLSKWKQDPDFKAEYERILSTPAHVVRLQQQAGIGEVREDPKGRFLYWYSKNNMDRNAALDYAGVQPAEVSAWLDPASETFDQAFAYQWEQLQIRRRWTIEDRANQKAIEGDGGMQRFILPAELPEKFGRSGTAGTYVEKVNIFGAQALENAKQFLSTLFAEPAEDGGAVRGTAGSPSGATSRAIAAGDVAPGAP